jgi:hypothetical protein
MHRSLVDLGLPPLQGRDRALAPEGEASLPKEMNAMPLPETPDGLSRRALLRSALVGAAGFSTLGFGRSAKAQTLSAMPVGLPVSVGGSPVTLGPFAVGGGTGGNLAAVNAALTGTGLYIGNEGRNWSDATWQSVFAQIRGWGFSFVCPKVGGYGSTWYTSDTQLAHWRSLANGVNLGYAPFIYSVPSSYVRDAQICSDIANICGIAVVDMEDEWGVSGSTNYNTQMTGFGSTYRALNPNTPIIVTGYGDPTTRFGANGWPFASMAAWADAYSPQWYYGDWSEYGGVSGNVRSAINWGDSQCGQVFGANFPLCPSVEIYSDYSSSGILPAADLVTGETYVKNWQAPIFWWEYSDMTAAIAASLVLPGPQDVSAAVNQSWGTAFYNPVLRQITQTVTLTNTSVSPLAGPLQVLVTGLPTGVTLANTGGSYNGSPYVVATTSALGSGASLSVLLRLNVPSTARFSFGAQVFSGNF